MADLPLICSADACNRSIAYHSLYLKPYHAAELVEPLLSSVKPSLWTSVCSDDELMRRLLSVHFLYQYPTFTAFHKDYFLKDMAAHRQNFCSTLLVNAVLAYSCVRVAYQSRSFTS